MFWSRKPRAGSAPGKQDGNNGETGLAVLACEGVVHLALLPVSEALRADENGDGAAGIQGAVEGLRPGLAWDEVPAVEKGLEVVGGEVAGDGFDLGVVLPVVADEDVELGVCMGPGSRCRHGLQDSRNSGGVRETTSGKRKEQTPLKLNFN